MTNHVKSANRSLAVVRSTVQVILVQTGGGAHLRLLSLNNATRALV